MKGGSKLFLIAGVGLAVVAVALLLSSMRGKEKAGAGSESEVTKVTVVEAVVAIPAHSLLTAEDLIEVEVPNTEATADSVTTKAEVIGQAYSVNLVQGQRLLKSQTEKPGIGNVIDPGKRAISLPAADLNLLSGLIQDGDYVDVIFHARINPVRILPTNLAETPEDEPYYKYGGSGGSSSGSDSGDSSDSSDNGDDDNEDGGGIEEAESGPIAWVPAGIEIENHPAVGDEGSTFLIRDDIKDEQQLEPVAKVIVQDVEVLRVVRPGQSFDSTGADSSAAGGEDSAGISIPEDGAGYLVLEVTPAQAEALTFMQDERHTYQVVVRSKDDHAIAETEGITFEILATGDEWGLPWPKPVTAPKEQAASRSSSSQSDQASEAAKDS